MKNVLIEPPAIVRASDSLDELASRINSVYAMAEDASRKGLVHYREVGLMLIAAKEKCGHGKFLKWLKENRDNKKFPFSQRQAYNYMELAELAVTANLSEQMRAIWGNDKPKGDRDSDDEDDEHNHRAQGTGENEWYTPPDIIEAAREVLGAFDLDPASNDTAQETVRAKKYFTQDDDGLTQEWHGCVWLNPPYSQPAITHFVEKLVAEYQSGRVTEAILLTHNYTDTSWFHTAASACTAVCFTRGRIAFLSPTGEKAAPTQGQAFTYFGDNVEKFREHFASLGFVLTREGCNGEA